MVTDVHEDPSNVLAVLVYIEIKALLSKFFSSSWHTIFHVFKRGKSLNIFSGSLDTAKKQICLKRIYKII